MTLKTKIGFLIGLTLSCALSNEEDNINLQIIKPIDLTDLSGNLATQRQGLIARIRAVPPHITDGIDIPSSNEPLERFKAVTSQINNKIIISTYAQLEYLIAERRNLAEQNTVAQTELAEQRALHITLSDTNNQQAQNLLALEIEKARLELGINTISEQLITKQRELAQLHQTSVTEKAQLEQSLTAAQQEISILNSRTHTLIEQLIEQNDENLQLSGLLQDTSILRTRVTELTSALAREQNANLERVNQADEVAKTLLILWMVDHAQLTNQLAAVAAILQKIPGDQLSLICTELSLTYFPTLAVSLKTETPHVKKEKLSFLRQMSQSFSAYKYHILGATASVVVATAFSLAKFGHYFPRLLLLEKK